MMNNEAESFTAGTVERKLGNGNRVVYNSRKLTVTVVSPDDNPWSIKHVEKGYTLEQFNTYCNSIATLLSTRVFPWQKPTEIPCNPLEL